MHHFCKLANSSELTLDVGSSRIRIETMQTGNQYSLVRR
jgi:hypothetical protein